MGSTDKNGIDKTMKRSYPSLTLPFRSLLLYISLMLLAFTIGDNRSEYNVPISPLSIFAVDLSLDNSGDILIGHKTVWGYTNKSISILKNDGNGYFETVDTNKSFCGSQKNIFATKINEDEYPDIVAFYSDFSSGAAERYVRTFKNENGNFHTYTDFNLNSSETFTTINYGDIDGINQNDIVVVSALGQFWGVLYNDGLGNFSAPQYHSVSDFYPLDIACGDLNDDGRDDVVIGGGIEIFFSYPDNFQSLFLDVIAEHIEITDFDFDGDLDILGAKDLFPGNSHMLNIIENLGNENFLLHDPILFEPACHFYFTTTDFNNDSLPDLLFHPMVHNNLLVLYNNGDFTLSEPQFIPMTDYGEGTRRSACADFDGNGYNDIATIRSWGAPLPSNVNILFNDGQGNFVDDPITAIQTSNSKLQSPNLICYPNPFTAQTKIEYNVYKKCMVNLSIYNSKGQKIKTLNNKKLQKGKYKHTWNGTDKNGKEVSPGIYIISLFVGGQKQQCRIVYTN